MCCRRAGPEDDTEARSKMIPSVWRRIEQRLNPRTSPSRRNRRSQPRFSRLRLESLEERAVPATSAFFSMPTNLTALQGTSVLVPVSIDHLTDSPNDQGLYSATIVITYDSTAFTVANGDISVGSLLTNAPPNSTWTFTPDTHTAGEVDITVTSPDLAHDVTSTVGGVLANIN